jgi:hypothetical protein
VKSQTLKPSIDFCIFSTYPIKQLKKRLKSQLKRWTQKMTQESDKEMDCTCPERGDNNDMSI